MATFKTLRRRWLKWRNRLAARFFETRYGRELLISALPERVLTVTTDCGDHRLTFSPHDYIGRKVYRKGQFEREGVQRLIGLLDGEQVPFRGKVLLEIGGNIGTQTIYWALTGLFRHIVSIEADPRNFDSLVANIRQNQLETLVTLVPCAAGETQGRIDFFQNRNNHGKSSAIRQSASDLLLKVPVKPVSQILTETGFDAADIGLIWMDIEGYEPVAARAMRELMAAGTPFYLEFSPDFYGAEADEFRRDLARFYRRALVLAEGRPMRWTTPAALPLDEGQFDVLLLA
nr:FkbM family methyltransferase [uncultured Gellertiella sp.]